MTKVLNLDEIKCDNPFSFDNLKKEAKIISFRQNLICMCFPFIISIIML